MQHRFITLNDYRVPGIMSALEANNRRDLIGQQVNDFTFAFITPLSAENDNIFTH